jgi:hypothetical protein
MENRKTGKLRTNYEKIRKRKKVKEIGENVKRLPVTQSLWRRRRGRRGF